MIMSVVVALAIGAGGAYDSAFQRGNSAYEQGDFDSAIGAYEQLLAEGVIDTRVFYNLGNAYYRAGNLGAAIANYERAIHASPTYEPALRNLEYCVAQTERQWGRPLPPPWQEALLMWHDNWSPWAVYRLAVLCWVAFWILLALRLWKPDRRLTRAAIVMALAAAAFATSAYAKYHPPLLAVATRDQTPVRFGPGESRTQSFELLRGDRVVVDIRRGGWAQVRNADGERGWVEERELAFVGPPYVRPNTTTTPDGGQGDG